MNHTKQKMLRLSTLLLLLPAMAQAQLNYSTNANTLTVTGYSGTPTGLLTIPGTNNGLPVVAIGPGALQSQEFITGVLFSTNVTSIGSFAFQSCGDLTNVTLSADVTNLGMQVFNNCRDLTNITVNSSNAFYSSAGGVLFNHSQTTLMQHPAGLGGTYAVPNGVTNIGAEAFASCIHLTSVSIPSSVTSIGDEAFEYGINMTAITVDPNNTNYSSVNNVLFNKNQTTLVV